MGAHRLVRTFKKQGNTVIGAGCYAAALESKADANKIIKVGTTTNDPWVDYYHEIIKPNQANPFVPKVSSFYMDKEADYYICVMEKLKMVDYNSRCDISYMCTEFLTGRKLEEELIEEFTAQHSDASIDHLLFILYKLKEFTDVLVEDCDKEYPYGARRLDLHEQNIMFRGIHPVITDPWSDVNMDEVGDFGDWICDNGLMN